LEEEESYLNKEYEQLVGKKQLLEQQMKVAEEKGENTYLYLIQLRTAKERMDEITKKLGQ
jgi:hypothetical protein